MSQTMHKCNLCGSSELIPLIDFGSHPVVKHYLCDCSEVQPTWPVKLYFCEYCGLTQLVDSCPPDVLYDNYVTMSSWKFQPHVQHEINEILFEIKEKKIEIPDVVGPAPMHVNFI